MKFISTFHGVFMRLILFILPLNLLAQPPWANNKMNRKEQNFFEVRQSFNNFWEGKVKEGKGKIPKSKGYKQFKRWEWFWEPRVGKKGIFPSSSIIMDEWGKYQSTHPKISNNPTNNNIVLSSRDQLKPNDPLKNREEPTSTTPPPPPSTSGNWVSLGPSTSAGGYAGVGRLNCIAFHPTDANTFWVGSPAGGLWKTTTGGTSWTTLTDNLPVLGVSAIAIDRNNANNMYIATGDRDGGDTYSVGVLKSTNGGTSWSATGLNYNVSQNILIKGLLIHPTNPLILLAATSGGIYVTTNGGTNWTLKQSGNFQEILFKPGDPTTVYASSIGSAQIFKSVNTGESWTQVTSFSGIYRVALAVTPANPSIVGALCSNNSDYGFGGYYTSSNSGTSFSLTYASTGVNLLGWDRYGGDTGGQGWYDLCLAISPTNSGEIYVGGVNTWKSTNGGSSWSMSTMWYDGTGVPAVHADKHLMAYSPLNSTLYQCNDGGLYKTSNGGTSWTDLSNGLFITQLYRMGNSATNANLTIAGTQDNGTKLRNLTSYSDVIGGDGMESIIDYTNANTMYGSLYYGEIYKSTDGGANFTNISSALPAGAWVTPYIIDPVNPQILYVGAAGNVWKTINGGSSWSQISTALSSYELQSLAIAPSNTQTIFAGSYWNLYKTINGGGSWTSISLPNSFDALETIEVHPTNPNIVYITFSGYGAGNRVYRSDNGGTSWTNISGTLPNLPVNTIEFDKNTGNLYLGNDVGVFVRTPTMTDWQVFDVGLPNVIVNELEIQYSSGRLRAATYGRGLWESDLFNGTTPPPTYCDPVYESGCAYSDFINNFSFNTLVNNNSGCSNTTATGYTNYTPAGALTTTVKVGQSYSLSMQSGSWYSQGFGVWIDYNNDKDFNDAGEFVYASPSAGTGVFSTTINIPLTATTGLTRLRVRCRYNGTFTSSEPCTAFTYGEAEDYTIAISAVQWDKRFGGSANDNITSIIKTSDGGYLLGGLSASGVSGDKTQASQGGQDFWIVKVNSSGTKQWDKRFGGSTEDILASMVQTSDGGYLLAGTSSSGISGDKSQASQGGRDYWIVKITSAGIKQWDKRFGGSADDYLRAITKTTDGGYLLAGVSASGLSGDKSQSSQGGQDYWVVKVTSAGAKQWDKRFGGSSNDPLERVITTTDGGYLLGGRSMSGISGDKTEASRGLNDYWVVKVNSAGTKQWDKRFGGTADDNLYGLTRSTDGGYLLAGYTKSGAGGDKTETSRGANDLWIVKINSTGIKQWDKRFGGSSEEFQNDLIQTTDGGYLIAGTSSSGVSGDKTQATKGGYDYWIVKVNSTGTKQWDKRYGGTGTDQIQSVLQSADGGYLLGGISNSGISGDKTEVSRGLNDYWLVKIGSTGASSSRSVPSELEVPIVKNEDVTGMSKSTIVSTTLNTNPNPFKDQVKIQFTLDATEKISLKVYNAQGLEVANLFNRVAEAGPYQFTWNAGHNKPGIYIVRLIKSNTVVSSKIVLVK